mmetsp:Transcript_23242/g.58738  ORF Transcript_23242/g.58738 Transcript_23242/m.58738 type:complete len:230 (+) Transcript_23242:1365-2054(+)
MCFVLLLVALLASTRGPFAFIPTMPFDDIFHFLPPLLLLGLLSLLAPALAPFLCFVCGKGSLRRFRARGKRGRARRQAVRTGRPLDRSLSPGRGVLHQLQGVRGLLVWRTEDTIRSPTPFGTVRVNFLQLAPCWKIFCGVQRAGFDAVPPSGNLVAVVVPDGQWLGTGLRHNRRLHEVLASLDHVAEVRRPRRHRQGRKRGIQIRVITTRRESQKVLDVLAVGLMCRRG